MTHYQTEPRPLGVIYVHVGRMPSCNLISPISGSYTRKIVSYHIKLHCDDLWFKTLQVYMCTYVCMCVGNGKLNHFYIIHLAPRFRFDYASLILFCRVMRYEETKWNRQNNVTVHSDGIITTSIESWIFSILLKMLSVKVQYNNSILNPLDNKYSGVICNLCVFEASCMLCCFPNCVIHPVEETCALHQTREASS